MVCGNLINSCKYQLILWLGISVTSGYITVLVVGFVY